MRRLRGSVLALALLALAGAVAVTPALGAATSKVTVGIGFEPAGPSPFFRGRVRSERPSCVANRPVRVFRQRNQGALTFFGATRSDSKGFWRIPLHQGMKRGGYLAVVKAKRGCSKAFSDPLAIK